MEQKRTIDINDTKKLVGKILTLIEATVPGDRQEAAKQLAIQTIWQTFDVVGDIDAMERDINLDKFSVSHTAR